MGDINLISITQNGTERQPTRTIPQTTSPATSQITRINSTIDESFNFSQALESPCVVTMSYFEESLPGLPRQISPPIGRMSQPSVASSLHQSHSSLSSHVSPCDHTKQSNGSVKTDSGFSSWTGNSDLKKKNLSLPSKPPSERSPRYGFRFSPDSTYLGRDLRGVQSSAQDMRLIPQPYNENLSVQNRCSNVGLLSCTHPTESEITDQLFMKRLDVSCKPLQNFTDSDLHLPVSSSPVVHVPDSSLPPCCFVSYEQDDLKATGVTSPHWPLEPIIPTCPIPGCFSHPRPESASNHSGGSIRISDEDDSTNIHVNRCIDDTDGDGDDESEIMAINRVSNRSASLSYQPRPHRDIYTTGPTLEGHPLFPVGQADTNRIGQHTRETNAYHHTIREPLWLRRRHPPGPLCMSSCLSRHGCHVNTPPHVSQSTEGTTDIMSPNSPSQYHHFQPSSIPDVVPRNLCCLRVPPMIGPLTAAAPVHLTPLRCLSFNTRLQLRCSSVPLIPSSPRYPPSLESASGCRHLFSHRLRTGRNSQSFSMQSVGGVGLGPAAHHRNHLSILARRMADIGDELDAGYQTHGRLAGTTEHPHGTHSSERINDSIWNLSSSLASLVTAPFDCIHRIFQLAGRSLSGASLPIQESPTRRTGQLYTPTRRHRTATFASTGSGRHCYPTPHSQMNDTVDMTTPNSRPPRTAPVHLPSRTWTLRQRLPCSIPLDESGSPQQRTLQESAVSRQTTDEIFSFDH